MSGDCVDSVIGWEVVSLVWRLLLLRGRRQECVWLKCSLMAWCVWHGVYYLWLWQKVGYW
jgi:hypothetical protein